MIDTHTHLYLPDFNPDGGGEAAVERAFAAGVDRMIFPNVDAASVEPLERLAAKYPGKVFRAMGLHPTEVNGEWRPVVDAMMERMDADPTYVAVGEVGIDLYWDKTFEQEQMEAFDFQVAESVKRGLPLIIHCREGLPQALEVLSGHPEARGVFHSFG
ncbi:MAG: TatD family hydrolase, partial [Muribaculaceae bacterium]|nr:TatD family hydrolase [Muribaculaceae bacterium]